MELVLVRHGEASARAGSDRERALTAVGEAQAAAAANWLAAHWRPDRLACSPYLRARQTAGAFLHYFSDLDPVSSDALTPDTPLAELTEWLSSQANARLLLVGHNPLLSNAIPWFCGPELQESMATASMAMITMDIPAPRQGRLAWLRHYPDYAQVVRRQ